MPCISPAFQELDIHIDGAALDLWKDDKLEHADALLTAAITTPRNPTHHALANRALIRTRLRNWDAALVDAQKVLVALRSYTPILTLVYTKAIQIQPSVIAFIAKSLAHVGNGERNKAYRSCDIAFQHFHSSHVGFLLLAKVRVF